MPEEKKEKIRTPRNAESILAGALKLDLAAKVELIKELKKAIQDEVDEKVESANNASAISKGL